MSPRATPMSPDERRAALIEVTVPLLHQHGRAVTTRLIAEAAGIAEGTIFRVFDSKEDLVDAAIMKTWDPNPFLEDVAGVDPDQPFRERCVALVGLLQLRFTRIFTLMGAVGMVSPPEDLETEHGRDWRRRADRLIVDLIGPDEDLLRVPLHDFIRTLRLLTFSASHAQISDGETLTPEQIVDTLLYGSLRPQEGQKGAS